MEPKTLREVDNDQVYYTVCWSRLKKVDKYDIIRTVPAMAGIFELYYKDRQKKLILLYFAWVWYGGLRHTIRAITDPELSLTAPKRRRILEEQECYYRYSLVASQEDMEDIHHFYASQRLREAPPSSQRFVEIFLKEESPDNLITI